MELVVGLACTAVCFSVLGAIIWLVVRSSAARQRERDLKLAILWDNFQAVVQSTPTAYLCHVTQVYQRAATGTKAIITWPQTGYQQDTWFADSWPAPGEYLLVTGSTGYGPHNNNPSVFYVDRHKVLCGAPPGALPAWHRHQQRLQQSAPRPSDHRVIEG